MKGIYLFLISLAFIVVSCNKSEDPAEKLKTLIQERDKLNKEIAALEKELDKGNAEKNDKLVKIVEIKPEVFKTYIRVQGKVDGDENAVVSTKVVGVVRNILVKPGDRVTKGQILATLDDDVLQSSLKELKAQYDFTLNVYEKQKRLWEQQIGSEIQYLTSKNNKEAMENRIKSLQEQINMYKITAPVSGTVEDISVKTGQAVSPGFTLMRIVNFSTLKVVADVSETYAAKINKGDEVEIFFPDLNETTTSKVTFASKYINPVNRTFVVEAQLNDKSIPYRANMVAILNITEYVNNQALIIPAESILNEDGKKFVFVAEEKNGKLIAVKKEIITGKSSKGKTEILQGINSSFRLIASNLQNLKEGQIIRPI